MTEGGIDVGNPKKQAGKREPLKPKTVGVRATGEWAEWIEQAARHCRTDVAKLIDKAVAKYVKEEGFDRPPPERIP